MHDWNDDITEGDPDAEAASGWLREQYVRTFVEYAGTWLANHHNWPIEWRRLAGSSDYLLELTPAQLEALMRELWAVVARVHAETSESAAQLDDSTTTSRTARDAQRVLLFIHDFPEGERPR